MNTTHDVFLIVDQDQRHCEFKVDGRKPDPQFEASSLIAYANVLGNKVRKLALISTYDLEGLSAYQKAGYETVAVNGNRQEELKRLIEVECDWIQKYTPKSVVLMTTDPDFALLANQATNNPNSGVYIWADISRVPKELTRFMIRDLNILLPSRNRISVFLDYENLYIGLKKAGYPSDSVSIVNAIRDALHGLGEVTHMSAYADWDALRQGDSVNIQRELVQLDIDTQYLINKFGKNSADMRMTHEVWALLEKRLTEMNQTDILVLGTGDRDFRDLVKIAKARGIKVIILSLRSSLSATLSEIATEVRYLDNFIDASVINTDNDFRNYKKYATLTLKIHSWMKQRHYRWAFVDELIESLDLGVDQLADLQHLIDSGIFRQSKRWRKQTASVSITLQMNHDEPFTRAVEYFSNWVCKRVDYCLRKKGMPYVDTNYLVKGMFHDIGLRQLGIGQNPRDARLWLNYTHNAGLLKKQSVNHPNNAERQITTWQTSQ